MQHGGRRDASPAASGPVRAAAQVVATLLVAALLALVPVVAAPQAGAVSPGSPGVAATAVDPGTPEVGLATGHVHSCALTTGGTVDCWGDNSLGQSTDQTATTYVAVSAGDLHTCAITTAGTVDCWGYNDHGQAVDQTATTYVAVSGGARASCAITSTGTLQCWGDLAAPPAGTYKAVSVGASHACAVSTGGGVECWGDNSEGKATDQPFGTPGAGIGYTTVGVGQHHSCALTSAGTVDCWGGNAEGQAVDQSGLAYTALAVGSNHTCAISTVLVIDCWGRNTAGQAVDQSPTTGVLAIAAGGAHTCALLLTGSVDCWGDEGQGRAADQPGPGFLAAGLSGGMLHACAVVAGGSIDCWGKLGTNEFGQLDDQTAPQYVAVSSGTYHNCALTLAATVDCWGDDSFGQAEDQTSTGYAAVSVGGRHSCALTAAGAVDCWGDDSFGQAEDQSSASYVAVDAGGAHACALTAAGTIDCWGRNVEGQATDQTGTTYTAVSAGELHTCALTVQGRVDCWGRNVEGQATDQIGATYRAVSSGTTHTCAITIAGALDCWGVDDAGEAADRSDTVYTEVVTGGTGLDSYTCARAIDGRIRCWGTDIGPLDPFLVETLNPPAPLGLPPRSFGIGDVVARNLFGPTLSLVAPTFAVVGGALPPGLSLSPSGQLSGTPTATGDYSVDVAARTAYAESRHTRTISVRHRPVIVPPPDQIAQPGTPLTLSFYVADEDSPLAGITNITGAPNPGPVSSDPTVLPDGSCPAPPCSPPPSSGIALSGTGFQRTITLTPTTEAGTVTVTFGVRDDSGLSTHASFQVAWVAAPTVSPIADPTTPEGTPVGPLAFIVSDQNDPATSLTVTAASSNPALVPVDNIVVEGSGVFRTVTVTPVDGGSGTADITLTVTDPIGLTAIETFTLTVTRVRGTISGTVTEEGSGTALGGVQVRLISGSAILAKTTTASDGSYAFDVSPASGLTLRFVPSATHVGEYHADATSAAAATPITVGVGSEVDIDIALSSAAGVVGTITDATSGLPVVDHLVTVYRNGKAFRSTRTNGSGGYSFTGLPTSGRWELRVADGTTHGQQWWPAAPVRALATPLTLVGGSSTTADAEVTAMADLPTLSGSVVMASDGSTPLSGVKVWLSRSGVTVRSVVTVGDGSYDLGGLLPGTYRLKFVDPAGIYATHIQERTISVGPTAVDVSLLER